MISERKISYTAAYVTLNVADLDESRNKIKLLIKNYKGFIIRSNEKTRTSSWVFYLGYEAIKWLFIWE
ncbi:hypothetical protein LEP1GSC038_1962 [Leptospira weilii str. 2006001855]|uniref:Uncharacterized protein n=2 Tax=Leptospira weilii TaxID=28184 RepID=M6QC38_9LEPT|nr:hypothetical protein LEP1GSC038_1962 [Leptospira weilii str. 2006001855]EMN90183.1 hypothetical protein LEP1GSC108_4855 [Leptospira weilii str. UI 13098]OMI17137.1 hypothetical protein BUQ74_11715 [Leptospira weilii serovar Heyan]QDK21785.1 hypothetical protein FHG67_02755 [Leptospira weilii]QDK25723.1 hypothetical protein FHG68_02605 [Leptospira weilii]